MNLVSHISYAMSSKNVFDHGDLTREIWLMLSFIERVKCRAVSQKWMCGLDSLGWDFAETDLSKLGNGINIESLKWMEKHGKLITNYPIEMMHWVCAITRLNRVVCANYIYDYIKSRNNVCPDLANLFNDSWDDFPIMHWCWENGDCADKSGIINICQHKGFQLSKVRKTPMTFEHYLFLSQFVRWTSTMAGISGNLRIYKHVVPSFYDYDKKILVYQSYDPSIIIHILANHPGQFTHAFAQKYFTEHVCEIGDNECTLQVWNLLEMFKFVRMSPPTHRMSAHALRQLLLCTSPDDLVNTNSMLKIPVKWEWMDLCWYIHTFKVSRDDMIKATCLADCNPNQTVAILISYEHDPFHFDKMTIELNPLEVSIATYEATKNGRYIKWRLSEFSFDWFTLPYHEFVYWTTVYGCSITFKDFIKCAPRLSDVRKLDYFCEKLCCEKNLLNQDMNFGLRRDICASIFSSESLEIAKWFYRKFKADKKLWELMATCSSNVSNISLLVWHDKLKMKINKS